MRPTTQARSTLRRWALGPLGASQLSFERASKGIAAGTLVGVSSHPSKPRSTYCEVGEPTGSCRAKRRRSSKSDCDLNFGEHEASPPLRSGCEGRYGSEVSLWSYLR